MPTATATSATTTESSCGSGSAAGRQGLGGGSVPRGWPCVRWPGERTGLHLRVPRPQPPHAPVAGDQRRLPWERLRSRGVAGAGTVAQQHEATFGSTSLVTSRSSSRWDAVGCCRRTSRRVCPPITVCNTLRFPHSGLPPGHPLGDKSPSLAVGCMIGVCGGPLLADVEICVGVPACRTCRRGSRRTDGVVRGRNAAQCARGSRRRRSRRPLLQPPDRPRQAHAPAAGSCGHRCR